MITHPADKLGIGIFNIKYDYQLIYPSYDANYGDFHKDFESLPFDVFLGRISASSGYLSDIFSARSKLLHGKKMHKDERASAYQSLNAEQIEYFKKEQRKSRIKQATSYFDGLKNKVLENVKKNKEV